MHYFKKILIWIFVFSYVCTDTVIMAESARQTAGFEAKDFQDRVEMIADQLKATEKTIKKTISDHLYEARLLLNRNRFKKARESVKKAFEAKEAGRKTIENKIRELAAIEARKRAEERIFGETLTKVKEYSFDYDDKAEVPSVDESIESAETLLSDIAYEEENYEIGQKKKREAEARKAMEKELRRQAGEIAIYIEKAREELARDNFEEARKYVKKAIAISKSASRQKSKKKPVYTKGKRTKKQQVVEKQGVESIAEKIRKETLEVEKQMKKVEEYLKQARVYLKKDKFNNARKYVAKALNIDEYNVEAQEISDDIDLEEKKYKIRSMLLIQEKKEKKKEASRIKEAKKREAKKIKEAKKNAARRRKEEAKRKETREPEVIRTKDHIQDVDNKVAKIMKQTQLKMENVNRYLKQSRKALKSGKPENARKYALKALKLDNTNPEARQIIEKIEADKGKPEQQFDKAKAEREKIENKALKEFEKKEIKQKRIQRKTEKYTEKAKKYLSKKDYKNARKAAYMAREHTPEDVKIAKLITQIDKEEMFGIREKYGKEREAVLDTALAKSKSRKDPLRAHEEGRSWMDILTGGIFSDKGKDLGDVQEGRVYTIDECVQIALHRSQRMKAAREQLKVAEMRVWETRRDLFPEVTGRIERSFGKIGVGTTGETRHYEGEKYSLDLKHNLFNGMGSWFTLRRAQTNQGIVELEMQKTKEEIVAAVKVAYYNLDKADKVVKIQEQNQKIVSGLNDITQKSYQQELVSRVESLKIKGQDMQSTFQYDSSLEDAKLSKMILFQAMDMEPEESISIKPVERPKNKLVISLENCYTLALVSRPDLKIKESTIEYYELERKIAKAKGWPKIDFQGSFGQAFENYQPMRDGSDTDTQKNRVLSPEWYAGIKGSLPLWGNTVEYNYVKETWSPTVSAFRGTETATSYMSVKLLDDLAYFTDVKEARAGFENAKAEYVKAKDDMMAEVKEAYFKYKKSLLQIEVAEAQIEHQQMFVDVLEERSRFGEMELSRVIEEYTKLTEHKYGLVQGDTSYFIALAELNKAVGIPEYFKPQYEDQEYEKWKSGVKEYTSGGKTKGKTPSKKRKKNIASKLSKINVGPAKADRPIFEKTEKREKDEDRLKAIFKKERDKKEAAAQKLIQKVNEHLKNGRKALDDNQFDKARALVKKALSISTDNEEAKELLKNIDKEEKIYIQSVKRKEDHGV